MDIPSLKSIYCKSSPRHKAKTTSRELFGSSLLKSTAIARGYYLHRSAVNAVVSIQADVTRQAKRNIKQLSADLENAVVHLTAPNPKAVAGNTDVYLLAMSHVSQESVQAVRKLIAAIRPEVVLIELCKDRVGLMLNPNGPKEIQLWNSRRVSISGLPAADGWPTESELLTVVATRPGRAFTTPDVETDCVRLLATGLFKSVRPVFKRPSNSDAPQFVRLQSDRLATVPPLGTVDFVVTPRKLAPPLSFSARVDSSLAAADIEIPKADVARIEESLLAETSQSRSRSRNKKKKSKIETDGAEQNSDSQPEKPKAALDAILKAERALREILSCSIQQDFDISLQGVESGEIEAVIRSKRENFTGLDSETFSSADLKRVLALFQGYKTGLEGSAEGGEGPGIDTFTPQRGPLQISSNLKIPNLAKILKRDNEYSADYIKSVTPSKDPKPFQPWTLEQMDAAENLDASEAKESVGTKFANFLSETYARFQNAAGEKVGLEPGAAWREALEAAAEHGGCQVHLGDLPADLAAQGLGKGIWKGLSARVSAAAVITAAALTASVAHLLPEGTESSAAGLVAAATGFAVFPFLKPILEIYWFSRKSAEQIEETVRIKENLQARGTEMLLLPGEDAIVDWPNAKESIIDRRDAFMARTIWAAATGAGASPAYVLDTTDERHTWHYVMPEGAPPGCAVQGAGLGQYKAVQGAAAVVAVVGSAHVGGIVREWERAEDLEHLSKLLTEE